ncbi:hypothetical protein TNCV_2461011 [Trichonephila clavipes]|nr:hypothetical protein TNCV_2461011 [Trichonephila clavipes]
MRSNDRGRLAISGNPTTINHMDLGLGNRDAKQERKGVSACDLHQTMRARELSHLSHDDRIVSLQLHIPYSDNTALLTTSSLVKSTCCNC